MKRIDGKKNEKKNILLTEMENNIRILIEENGRLIEENGRASLRISERVREMERVYEMEASLIRLNTQNSNLKGILIANGEQLDCWRQKFHDLEKLLLVQSEREKEGLKAIAALEQKVFIKKR